MNDSVKHIDPSKLSDAKDLRQTVIMLLQVIEEQGALIKSQAEELQKLRDEINRLKGEKGKPDIGKKNKNSKLNINKGDEHQDKSKNNKNGLDKSPVQIDRTVELTEVSGELPSDARIKSWEDHIVQDILLRRDTVKYRVGIWYSPSEGKTYRSVFPLSGYGSFGPQLQGLLHLLHYECNVTQGCLESFCDSLGLSISAGSIDNILKSKAEEAVLERKEILHSGIAVSPYLQADSTGSKEKGVTLYTQIFCSPLFTAYFSNHTKSRQQVLQSLCGLMNLADLPIIWNEDTAALLIQFKVPQKYQTALHKFINIGESSTIGTLKTWIDEHLTDLAAQKNTLTRVLDAFALAHYFQREAPDAVFALMSDDAPEYKMIALIHALCWIHDARDYKKLIPSIDINTNALNAFIDEYWKFYRSLLAYKVADEPTKNIQKSIIEAEFERIFTKVTTYIALDKLIARTYAKKKEMLLALEYPDIPLHNNAAELAARRKVRKRDVSLHTMSPKGTRVQDAYLSIIETAKKLKVSAYEYLTDFVSVTRKMIPLHKIIEQYGA